MTRMNSKSAGAIVLGMHDALVSLTGMIGGLTFALANRQTIVLSAVIASVAAGLSMGASNYLAEKTNETPHPIQSGILTSAAYITTCIFLIMPYFIITNTYYALACCVFVAILIIVGCNWCIRHAHGHIWWKHALQMLAICAIVSVISFIIGEFAQYILDVKQP